MTTQLRSISITLVAGLLLSPLAQADVRADLNLGPLIIKLIDLDTTDGIAPSILFGPSNWSGYNSGVAALLDRSDKSASHFGAANAMDPWGDADISLTDGQSGTNARVWGAIDATGQGTKMALQGWLSTGSTLGQWSGFVTGANGASEKLGFTLSANTLVTFEALVKVDLSVTDNPSSGNWAQGIVNLFVGGPSAVGQGGWQASEISNSWYHAGGETLSEEQTFAVKFTNPSRNPLEGHFGIDAQIYGFANDVTAVPEPSTYALMLAGLISVFSLQRRRHA